MIGPQTPQYIKDKFNYCKNNIETQSYEFLSIDKNGQQIWVNVTLTPILGADGKVSKIVSIDADITPMKKAEMEILAQKQEIEEQRDQLQDQTDYVLEQKDELERQKEHLDQTLEVLQRTQKKLVDSEKMAALGSLVAGVAHEVNTPVGIGIAASSSMVTKTELLEESFTSKKMTMSDLQSYLETTKQACELIFSNLNRTAELVKSFKQVSVDNMTEQKRTFNFLEYLNDIIRSLGPKIKSRPVKMILDCPDNIVITSYPGSYYQIITNFINNSLMHAFAEHEEGEMKISVFIENEIFKIIYTDNGKGIPKENLPKVFDPFFTTNMQVGTGLGMNITYNIITQHLGGEIILESTDGEGVKFTVTIPMDKLK
jgi:signal transduction histidine kinase